MGNKIKKTVAGVLAATMVMTAGVPAFAATENNSQIIAESAVVEVQQTTASIENYLAAQGSSVEIEYNKSIARLQEQLNDTEDLTTRENLKTLIGNYQTMLQQYQALSNKKDTGINLMANETEEFYMNMILTAIAYFDSNDLYLCSELLTHGANDHSGRTYTPTQTAHVYATTEYDMLQALPNGSQSSSGFEKRNTTAEKDLFYSIHLYNYSKQSNRVTLTDEYNFEHKDIPDYASLIPLLGNNFMYTAQNIGLIVPYDVTFTFSV